MIPITPSPIGRIDFKLSVKSSLLNKSFKIESLLFVSSVDGKLSLDESWFGVDESSFLSSEGTSGITSTSSNPVKSSACEFQ